jgi:hypothetical protein
MKILLQRGLGLSSWSLIIKQRGLNFPGRRPAIYQAIFNLNFKSKLFEQVCPLYASLRDKHGKRSLNTSSDFKVNEDVHCC